MSRTITNGEAYEAADALKALAAIGTKDRDVSRKHNKLLRAVRGAVDDFLERRDMLVRAHAKRAPDEHGQESIATRHIKSPAGDVVGTEPVYENEIEYSLAYNALTREPATVPLDTIEPLSWDDITKYAWKEGRVDVGITARLGALLEE